VAFHKSSAMGGRLTKVEDIAPIFKFLCLEGGWINGSYSFSPTALNMILTKTDVE
jgi:hypothetical protein